MAKLLLHFDCTNRESINFVTKRIKNLAGESAFDGFMSNDITEYDFGKGLKFINGSQLTSNIAIEPGKSYTMQFKFLKLGATPGGNSIYPLENRYNKGLFIWLNNYAANNTGAQMLRVWDYNTNVVNNLSTPSIPGLHTSIDHNFDLQITIDNEKNIGIIEERTSNYVFEGPFKYTQRGDAGNTTLMRNGGTTWVQSIKIYEGVVNLNESYLIMDDNDDVYRINDSDKLEIVTTLQNLSSEHFRSGMNKSQLNEVITKWTKTKFKILTTQKG